MAEFTGERVIPGEVDPDLWNEHIARYAFACRLSRSKCVLDIACGTGYGAAEMARSARRVTGIDISAEALTYAAAHFRQPDVSFVRASCTALPFTDRTFDLITAFEVIEHLTDWRSMLSEARRVLHPSGQFVVSTPNALYYAESRRQSGPNPFHHHEFTFTEFQQLLEEHFPHVLLFTQNHSTTVVFQPVRESSGADLRLEKSAVDPDASHFFLAVCAMHPQTGAPTFAYLPQSGNVLRERELHIQHLEGELALKDRWLDELQHEHQQLVQQFRRQTTELEARNQWAMQLDQELSAASQRIVQLQEELAAEQAEAARTVAAYESKLAELEQVNREKTIWAQQTEQRLTADITRITEELKRCVDLLHQAEALVEERTRWALQLNQRIEYLESAVRLYQASRWIRVGRRFGLGPEVPPL